MTARRKHQGAPGPRSAEKLAALGDWLARLGRGRGGEQAGGHPPGRRLEDRVEKLEARIEHLDAQLEGLQDAVYRQALLEDENIADLRRRTQPGQIARDLSQNARKRGL